MRRDNRYTFALADQELFSMAVPARRRCLHLLLEACAASRVVARFLDDTSVGVVLTTYGATAPVPTTITVPCEGKGVVRFAPRPSSSTSTPDFVAVTYVNVAA